MVRKWIFFLFVATQVHASIFDWFSPLSDRARRAKSVMEGFDPIVEKALKDYNVPGIAIGVVVDGYLVYDKGFGYRDLDKKLPVTSETIFQIGSCTKAFTSFLMGTLVEEGLLQWDQLVIDILPEFRLFDQYATQNLTMRDLLTHRSGMPRHDFMWYNSTMTRAEVIRKIRYLEPSCDLRTRYQYNNLMYLTAGCAMEALTNKTWEALVSERIVKPLGMNRTSFSVSDLVKEGNHSFPYIEKSDVLKKMKLREISLIGPAGSMNSSVSDLARWVQMQLNGGTFNKTPLISPATLQEMHTPQVIVPGTPETNESLLYAYGMGWGISSYRGQYFISHDGGIDGFTSVIGLLPQHGVGIIILSNRNLTSLPRFLSLQIMDRVLELPFIDWVHQGYSGILKSKESAKERKIKEDLARKKGTSPSHVLKDFVGDYEHPGYGTLSIELSEGKLKATLNDLSFLLDHWHYDVFYILEEQEDMLVSREGMKITFRGNVDGNINELVIPLEPNTSDIVFQRKQDEAYSTLVYLRQFVGLYEIYGYTVEVAVRNHSLCAIVPGQPLYHLIPGSVENEFAVKSMTGYSVRFVMNHEGKVEEALFIQPYGAFTAKPKK